LLTFDANSCLGHIVCLLMTLAVPNVVGCRMWTEYERTTAAATTDSASDRSVGDRLHERTTPEQKKGPDRVRPASWSSGSPSDWRESVEDELDSRFAQIARLPPVEGDRITFVNLLSDQADGVWRDHREFYSLSSLTWLTAGLGAGALMANTAFDERLVRDTYAENILFAPSDEFFEALHQPKFLGDGYYTIPAFAVAALVEPFVQDVPLGPQTAEWGQRSLRTILVGGPPLLALQWLTGGSRPTEAGSGSHWEPFQDDNGVSGHSFMGAIPFLSAAKMADNAWVKSGLYAASTLPALSRVNDDDHYFSQSFLGWWLAYLAASAVDRAHTPDTHPRWSLAPRADGLGVVLEY
jgi:hypothetical protein